MIGKETDQNRGLGGSVSEVAPIRHRETREIL